jgi:predicted nucleic acid-binding protein
VAVKWFSPSNEEALQQALNIRDAHISDQILVVVPDLFFYEVTNALVHKKFFSTGTVQAAAASLLALGLLTIPLDNGLLGETVRLARQSDITIYDACYAAIAIEHHYPLVTANPRHQKRAIGCRVIPLKEWKMK